MTRDDYNWHGFWRFWFGPFGIPRRPIAFGTCIHNGHLQPRWYVIVSLGKWCMQFNCRSFAEWRVER